MEKINNFSNKRIIAFLFAVFAVFVWGVTFVSTKYLLKDFSAVEILFFRFIAAYICLWIIYPKKLVIKDIKKELSFLFAGLTGVTMYQLFENMAINYTNASNVSIIVSICPLFTAITSQLFLKQKSITKSFVIGFFIAIIGVILVSFNGVVEFNLNPKGDMLALLSGICWGFYSLFVSKINSYSYNAIASTRRIFFYAIIFMLPVAILGSQFASPEKHSLFMDFSLSVNIERFSNLYNLFNILFLGVVASALCFLFWNKACAILGTVKVSLGIYLIPVVTIIFAYIVLSEPITIMGITGTVFTLSGVVISGYRKRH